MTSLIVTMMPSLGTVMVAEHCAKSRGSTAHPLADETSTGVPLISSVTEPAAGGPVMGSRYTTSRGGV